MALTTNLVSYYKLDEASGDAIDAHGSFDLTPAGDPAYKETGVIGDCIYFDGAGDYFEAGTDEHRHATFTFAAWFKRNDSSRTSTIAANYNWTDDGWDLYFTSSDEIRCYVRNSGGGYTEGLVYGGYTYRDG